MSEPVDTSAEAVEPVSHDQLATLCIAFGALAQRTQADSELQVLSALRELQALRRERAEQETLLAERNRQNAACWAECDGLRSRIYALRDSLRDESLYTAKSLRAAIDAAMGAKEGM